MANTNAPDKPYSSGNTIKSSPLKNQWKSGSISTKRDKPAPSGK